MNGAPQTPAKSHGANATPELSGLRDAATAGFAMGDMAACIAQHRMRLNSVPSKGSLPVMSANGTLVPAISSPHVDSFRRRSLRASRERRSSRDSDGSAGSFRRRASRDSDGSAGSVRRRKSRASGEVPDQIRRGSLREGRMLASDARKNSLVRDPNAAGGLAVVAALEPLPDQAADAQELIQEFFDAVAEGDSDLVDELLERGVAVNAVDDDGNTALLLASEGEPQIVEALIAAGANVNQQNNDGLTPLMLATRCEACALVPTCLCSRRRARASALLHALRSPHASILPLSSRAPQMRTRTSSSS